ncbi:protocadherin Fat 1-like protein [Sarcoptes scabiei]|uniref:Protocadherin Fat 1-like protein n=1 Tax=Sarcoptes scabiei TaxID=52283 RepID=A0A132AD92_SARSC|nr:protocadherin Fat 1-like protein [Sarcoptes scabiei]
MKNKVEEPDQRVLNESMNEYHEKFINLSPNIYLFDFVKYLNPIAVIGDAGEKGDIELSIIENTRDQDSESINRAASLNNPSIAPEPLIPVRIESGTKKLVLIRKLDKESIEGDSSVTVSVRCRQKNDRNPSKHSSNAKSKTINEIDPTISSLSSIDNRSFLKYETSSEDVEELFDLRGNEDSQDDIIIPIRILITDANDNKPEWQGVVPYSVNISEMTTIGTVVMNGIRAIDNDQLGPYSTIEYYVEPGPYSHLLRFSSPLEGNLVLSGHLDYETMPNFSITIRAQDQGSPPNSEITTVNVQVIDADDQNPRFEDDKYTAFLAENDDVGHALIVKPNRIKANDPDLGIKSPIIYEFNSKEENSKENSYFRIDNQTATVTLRRPLHSAINLPITLVIKATQQDNRDRYALTTLTIVNKRDQLLPELHFIDSNYSASLLETSPIGHPVMTLHTSQSTLLTNNSLKFQILDDEDGYFKIDSSGKIVVNRILDYEKHHRHSFRVMVSDGRQTDLARMTVNLINVNEHDPIFSQSVYSFHITEAQLRSSPMIGRIQASDADDDDQIKLNLSGPCAEAFSLNPDGLLQLRYLYALNSSECRMKITATDSGDPSRSSSASIVAKFSPTLLKSTKLGSYFQRGSNFTIDSDDLRSIASISPTTIDVLKHSNSNLYSASSTSTALVLVIVLGVLLGTLFIIIVVLTLHVLKNRKINPLDTINLDQNNEYCEEIDDTAKKSLKVQKNPNLSPSKTLKTTDSAISSDLSCWSEEKSLQTLIASKSMDSQSSSGFITNSIHDSEIPSTTMNDSCSNERRSVDCDVPQYNNVDEKTLGSRISVIRWPQGTIPRRVKKLTWKDEQRNNHLDQLYTSNSILHAETPLKLKTKTLSGHLLTGNANKTMTSKKDDHHASVQNNAIKIAHNQSEGFEHYHLHTSLSSIASVRHHQTPHYPIEREFDSETSRDRLVLYDQMISNQKQTASALPDLTIRSVI